MYNLILVGGTGKQFGVVLGWLNQLGLITPPNKLLVVDADVTGYDKVIYGLSYANPNFTAEHIRPYHSANASLNILSEMQISKDVSPLLDISFNEEEQLLNIKDGFFANPKLGATIFGHHQQLAQNNSLVSVLAQNGGKISTPTFIVGSVSGGTGAGLMYSIAKLCSSHRTTAPQAPVIGVVFSKYTIVDDSSEIVSNVKLQENSYNGISFLWNKFNQNKDDFAFDMVNVIGPPTSDSHPQFCVSAVTNGDVNSFPGFLIAAQLFKDGGKDITTKIAAEIATNQGKIGISAFAGRASAGIKPYYIHARDITFNVNNNHGSVTKVSADELRLYLKAVRNVLEEIIYFPMDEVVSVFSIFPLRKLPKELVSYLLNMNGKNQISKTTLLNTFSDLKTCASTLIANLLDNADSFIQWLNTLSNTGVEFSNEQDSSKIQFTSWLDATPSVSIQNISSKRNIAVDLMLKGICTNQVYNASTDLAPPPATQNLWLMPYLNHPLPSSLGLTYIETNQYLLNSIEINSNSGSCYPTALGRAEAFGQKLKQALSLANYQQAPAFQEAELLWCGLAMGVIKIKPLKLNAMTASHLEKLIGKFEGQHVIPLLEDSQGNIIGACHPEYGLWSGINGLASTDLLHIVHDLFKRNEAKSILRAWFDDVNQVAQMENFVDLNQRIWYRFLSQFLVDASPLAFDRKEFDLGAHAPLLLNVNHQNKGVLTELFYPYFYSPYRKIIREHMVAAIGQIQNPRGMLSMGYNSQTGIADINHPILKKIASIYIGSHTFVAMNNIDLALQEGCFTPVIDVNYPLDVIDPTPDIMMGLVNKFASQGIQLQTAYQITMQKHKVRKPELLWD